MTEKVKILVVEDEALVALDLRRRLEGFGHEISGVAASAEEALEVAAASPPGLVLMDVKLQGPVDGIEAARLLRRRLCVPVVFLTANADRATVHRALEAQPQGYVLKPFRDRELELAIELALYKHRAEAECARLVRELQASLAQVKRLTGLLPICASCKKIRDDKGYWSSVESYIQQNSEAVFSHGICPPCARILYPELKLGNDPAGPGGTGGDG